MMEKRLKKAEAKLPTESFEHTEIVQLFRKFRKAETEAEKWELWERAYKLIEQNSSLAYLRRDGWGYFIRWGWARLKP